ncbi:MAG: AsmA family protein, partial [Oxalobacteraceae bacterium]
MATVTHPESIPASSVLRDGPSGGRPIMTGWLAILLAILTTIVGLIVLTWSVLYITKGRFLKGTFERTVTGFSNRAVKVGG